LKEGATQIDTANDFAIHDKASATLDKSQATSCDKKQGPNQMCTFRVGFVLIKDKRPDLPADPRWEFYVDGKKKSGDHAFAKLPVGVTTTDIIFYLFLKPGRHPFSVVIDPDSVIEEDSETNNSFTVFLTLK
jgi:CARDB